MTLAELSKEMAELKATVKEIGDHVANLRIWQGWTKGFWFGLGALSMFAAAVAFWKASP